MKWLKYTAAAGDRQQFTRTSSWFQDVDAPQRLGDTGEIPLHGGPPIVGGLYYPNLPQKKGIILGEYVLI